MAFAQGVKPSSSNKNYAIEVSVSMCGENEEKGFGTFGIGKGDLHFENNNITNNKCKIFSSSFIELDGSSGTCNFSTFRENKQIDCSFYFNSEEESLIQTFSFCNVIGNKCRTGNETVLFYCESTVKVDYCIFLDNIAKCMFRQSKYGCALTISDSYVESNSTIGSGIEFNNLKGNYDFNTYTHLFKENCFKGSYIISIKISYLSKFAKTATPGLLSSQK
ncbi:hypothetical protein TVAG_112990 [Trichomonas vaginalis G3]|uniref:Right handed beta helix domain-containing protein n=1 Tax=Trichomonas vaginalis (strain ATCC PRA-98 / G3) TaxID=412133 RepID=A2F746_TRIV3|nr:hypothetical protein TVAGG3_0258700 [Trichomonas vaginalis G3]EAX99283.1 hypothetical protein TVAG_112990 [Trichomonas vaginalis G3]KAI5524949.1 hypothetical protein TVAGG3_0258700 [Trichomonas vaginalis G3]|eukprot:XP_001312213.1 hypothetical protein [Trichomonas vaginalis G3]